MAERVTQNVKKVLLCDGKDWDVRPLTLKQAEQSAPIIKVIQGFNDNTNIVDPEVFSNIVKICKIILQRSKKDITEEEVEDLIDMGNLKEVISAGFANK